MDFSDIDWLKTSLPVNGAMRFPYQFPFNSFFNKNTFSLTS